MYAIFDESVKATLKYRLIFTGQSSEEVIKYYIEYVTVSASQSIKIYFRFPHLVSKKLVTYKPY